MSSSYLASQFQLGSLLLQNRVVLAPLTRGRAGLSRVPNDLMKTYYEQRSGAGLIITEATAISDQGNVFYLFHRNNFLKGYGWNSAPGLYTDEHADAWAKTVDAVHAKGSKIFLQLWHTGRQSHSSFHTVKVYIYLYN